MSKGVHEDGLTNEQRSSMEKVAKQLGVSKENLKQFENTIKEVKKQNADATFDLGLFIWFGSISKFSQLFMNSFYLNC